MSRRSCAAACARSRPANGKPPNHSASRRRQQLWLIILPQSVKRMLPPWMNLYAILTTSTTLASIVGVNEVVTLAGQVLAAEGSRPNSSGAHLCLCIADVLCLYLSHRLGDPTPRTPLSSTELTWPPNRSSSSTICTNHSAMSKSSRASALRLRKGDVACIIGPSGSGKSTLDPLRERAGAVRGRARSRYWESR